MESKNYISIKTFCQHYGVDESFIYKLREYEIVKVHIKNKRAQLSVEELDVLEKMIRLNKELEINPEGLQAIQQLLQRVTNLQEEVRFLKRKLDLFDDFKG